MDELDLRDLVHDVHCGRTSRRSFIRRMALLGLPAPFANLLLLHTGAAQQQVTSDYKPTKRGGGGALRVLFWQGTTSLNPHLATGFKDWGASRIFYETLASYDKDGALLPVLAVEIPSLANGGVARDGRSVTWKLKRDVKWHDGHPFSADDLVFTWEYARNPNVTASSIGIYKDIHVSKVDDLTVRIDFEKPTPFWSRAFVGILGQVIPKHLFADFAGTNSAAAPTNLRPVGTGPYKFVEFKPGDMVRGELNANYHMPNRPHFDTIEVKGGGDAVSAARAVLQTGEYDYAWNLLVDDEILTRMESSEKGRVLFTDGNNIEYIQLNSADPWTEVDGERSSLKTRHPFLSDPAVRQAIALLVDRQSIQDHVFGRSGVATANVLNNPARYRSANTKWEFNIGSAEVALEAAGWKRGSDGIRAKDGKRLKLVFQTTINAARQKTQQVVKQAFQKAGVDVELKAVTATVFSSSDPGNPDTYTKFYADMQMYTSTGGYDPLTFMSQFCSWQVPTKENNWRGFNTSRWTSEEYDQAWRAAEVEVDPVKRTALFIKMNDLVVASNAVVPVVYRRTVQALARNLVAPVSAWDLDFAGLYDWYRS